MQDHAAVQSLCQTRAESWNPSFLPSAPITHCYSWKQCSTLAPPVLATQKILRPHCHSWDSSPHCHLSTFKPDIYSTEGTSKSSDFSLHCLQYSVVASTTHYPTHCLSRSFVSHKSILSTSYLPEGSSFLTVDLQFLFNQTSD